MLLGLLILLLRSFLLSCRLNFFGCLWLFLLNLIIDLFLLLLLLLKRKCDMLLPFIKRWGIFEINWDLLILNLGIYLFKQPSKQPDHGFPYISKEVVLIFLFRQKVVQEMSLQTDKELHFLPFLIGNFCPTWNDVLFINVFHIFFDKLKLFIVLFFA